MKTDDIIFEDLRGNPERAPIIEVDLDAGDEPGITRQHAEPAGGTPDETPDDHGREAADGSLTGDEGEEDELAAARREAREAREALDALNRRMADRDRAESKAAVERYEREITSIETRLEAAFEAGDTKAQVKLTSELAEAKAQRLAAKIQSEQEPREQPAAAGGPVKAQRWKQKNRWFGAKGKERYTRIAQRIDREIASEGYGVEDDDYYAELDRRMKREAPELFASDTRRPAHQPVASLSPTDGGAGERSVRAGSKVRLDEADFRNMRRFGLNPTDPKHCAEYARNKRESDAVVAARQQGAR